MTPSRLLNGAPVPSAGRVFSPIARVLIVGIIAAVQWFPLKRANNFCHG